MDTQARAAHLRDMLAEQMTTYTRNTASAESYLAAIGATCDWCTSNDDEAESCTCPTPLDDEHTRTEAGIYATLAAAAASAAQALAALVVAEETRA